MRKDFKPSPELRITSPLYTSTVPGFSGPSFNGGYNNAPARPYGSMVKVFLNLKKNKIFVKSNNVHFDGKMR